MSGVYTGLCQCDLAGLIDSLGGARFPQHHGWHHPGAPCSDLMWRCHQRFSCPCRCSRLTWSFPSGGDGGTMAVLIATKRIRATIHVLADIPPPSPWIRRGCIIGQFMQLLNPPVLEEFTTESAKFALQVNDNLQNKINRVKDQMRGTTFMIHLFRHLNKLKADPDDIDLRNKSQTSIAAHFATYASVDPTCFSVLLYAEAKAIVDEI